MNLNHREPTGINGTGDATLGCSQSATVSMSNQSRSATYFKADSSSKVSALKERLDSRQGELHPDNHDDTRLSLKQKTVIWLASFTATGYLISLLFHSTVLTLMAIVIVGGIKGDGDISTLVSLEDEQNFSLNGPLDTRIKEAGGQTTEFNVMQPIKTMTGENENTVEEIQEDFSAHLGKGTGESEGDGSGAGGGDFKLKPMGNAVTVGSFTAWTVPKDPDLNEDYLIIIQVKLPASYNSTRYRASDLSGLVLGTDDHRQAIPWDSKWLNSTFTPNAVGDIRPVDKGDYLPLKNRVAQLIVKVPGSKIPATRDTIKIRSRVLKENQTLEIVF
ncbi:hypothetical protein [Gimesia sp.]|uniref:hypothetical protein n=1 Tax=Gimesia sp. TaxID=2024833 RepID=UPI003A910844